VFNDIVGGIMQRGRSGNRIESETHGWRSIAMSSSKKTPYAIDDWTYANPPVYECDAPDGEGEED
jgi:hypothetical protein